MKIILSVSLIFVILYCQSFISCEQLNGETVNTISKVFLINDDRFGNKTLHQTYYSKSYITDDGDIIDFRTSLPIQMTLVLSDMLKLNTHQTISPMNIITCFDYAKTRKQYDYKKKYLQREEILNDINIIISYLQNKGSQFINNFPYEVDSSTGLFPVKCDENFKSDINIGNLSLQSITIDIEGIKTALSVYGSIVCGINVAKDFFLFRDKEYYTYDIKEIRVEWIFLRIIGWRIVDNITYFIFSYVGDENFGNWNYISISFDLILKDKKNYLLFGYNI